MFDAYALCAKCRAIRSQLLVRDDYAQLSTLTDIPSLLAALSRMGRYTEVIGDTTLHRADAEHLLRRSYYELYEKLLRFTGGAPRQFLEKLIEKYEVIYLVRTANALHGGVRARYAALPQYLQRHHDLDFSAICRATDVQSFLSALKGTKYYRIALAYLSGEPDLGRFENALYRSYYNELYHEACDLLDAQSAAAIRDLLAARADEINTERADRIARYGFPVSEETFLPIGTAANTARLQAILDGAQAPQSTQAKLALFERCSRIVSSGVQNMSVPTALLMLADTELANLTFVIEGIRYGVGSDAIMEKMICR